MNETGTDSQQAGTEGSKGKQTLVLFLLAGAMLLLPYLPLGREVSLPVYGIDRAAEENQWRIVSRSKRPDVGDRSAAHVDPFSQQKDTSRFFSDIFKDDDYPAELALFFNRPMPLNRSRQDDLELLPGIGPHLAAMLMAERQKKGRFAGPEDLLAVPGIGPATLQRLLPLVSFE